MDKNYPYLGVNYIDDKPYVVLFTEEEHGVVVMNSTDSNTIKFGYIGNFDEEQFEYLPKDQCVRLNN